jgi:hypothetical protein
MDELKGWEWAGPEQIVEWVVAVACAGLGEVTVVVLVVLVLVVVAG